MAAIPLLVPISPFCLSATHDLLDRQSRSLHSTHAASSSSGHASGVPSSVALKMRRPLACSSSSTAFFQGVQTFPRCSAVAQGGGGGALSTSINNTFDRVACVVKVLASTKQPENKYKQASQGSLNCRHAEDEPRTHTLQSDTSLLNGGPGQQGLRSTGASPHSQGAKKASLRISTSSPSKVGTQGTTSSVAPQDLSTLASQRGSASPEPGTAGAAIGYTRANSSTSAHARGSTTTSNSSRSSSSSIRSSNSNSSSRGAAGGWAFHCRREMAVHLPGSSTTMEEYLSQPSRVVHVAFPDSSRLQQLSPTLWRATLKPVSFFHITATPVCTIRAWFDASTGKLRIASDSLDLKFVGAPSEVQRVQLHLSLSGHLSPLGTQKQPRSILRSKGDAKTLVGGSVDLGVRVEELPFGLALIPAHAVNQVGSAILSAILDAMKGALQRGLETDFQRWQQSTCLHSRQMQAPAAARRA